MHLYGLIIGMAAVLWWSIVEYLEPRLKTLIPWVLLGAGVGARIYHVVERWEYYSLDWTNVLRVWEGGLSIWGALLLGAIVLGSGMRRAGVKVSEIRSVLGAVVTPLPLSQALGRVGNAVNGEFTTPIFGIPWWGAEALLDLVLFGVMWRTPREWRVFGYIVGYILIRLVLQPYRE